MALFNRRRALLYAVDKKPISPTFVQYLGGSGTQWIDTNYIPKENTAMEITYQLTDGNKRDSWFIIVGCFKPSTRNVRFQIGFNYRTNQINAGYGAKGTLIYGIDEKKHTLKIDGFNKQIIFDGKIKSTSMDPGDLQENQESIYLFTANQAGAVAQAFVNVFALSIYEKGILVRDFRPCLYPQTLEPVMYDMIQKKYYHNLGTGDFLYQP